MDFTKTIERRNTSCVKYHPGALKKMFGSETVSPFWIADTDFPSPQPVIDALQDRVEFHNFGYETYPGDLKRSIIHWFENRHGLKLTSSEIIFSHGVMTSVALLIDLLTKPGDGVIIQPPVYMAFSNTLRMMEREQIENPLLLHDGFYTIDFDDLESKAKSDNAKILLICNPHNPVGRVWDSEEMQKMIEICNKNDLILISDEIHSDLTFPANTFHSVLGQINDDSKAFSVYSPVKSFNLMSVSDGFVFTKNKELKHKLVSKLESLHLGHTNAFSTVANIAAFNHGQPYLDEFRLHILSNYIEALDLIESSGLPMSITKSEGTFLIWIDFREFGMNQDKLVEIMTRKAGLGLSAGPDFGTGGEGFFRMNIGCPKDILQEGLEKMIKAFS